MNLKKISKNEIEIIKNIILPYFSNHKSNKFKYVWKVSDKSWNKLGLNFDHINFKSDDEKRIAVKEHISKNWYSLDNKERFRVAKWIIKDWGGVKKNKDDTILDYVRLSLVEPKQFLFKGISSYSKILSFTNPNKFAIYDARVAASLNCLLIKEKSNNLLFPIPQSQNKTVKNFTIQLKNEALNKNLFFIENVYEAYLEILENISPEINQSIDYIEGILFTDTIKLIDEK